MELVRMALSDLRANPMNVRTSFAGIDELADRLELTPGRPGEPLYPIVAVRDANVARIVDGERRYRAMKKRGKVGECYVFLCDDMAEADQAVAILAANDRENLTDANVSAGYQQALMLGVPEEAVDRLAGRPVSRALRNATARNGGKAVQLSVDQIAAAEEFADSEEDYRAVMEADGWSYVANDIRQRREREAKKAALEEAVAQVVSGFGLVVADKPPKGAPLSCTLYSLDAERVTAEAPTWAAAGKVLVRPRRKGGEYGYMTPWELYDATREVTDEQAAAQRSRNRWRRIRSAGESRRREWIAARLAQGGGGMGGALMPVEMLVAQWYQDNRHYEVKEFCEKAGVDWESWPVTANAWMCADAWRFIDHLTNDECDHIADPSCYCNVRDPWKPHIELMRAMRAAGYEPDEGEKGFLELCEQRAAGSKRAKKGGE